MPLVLQLNVVMLILLLNAVLLTEVVSSSSGFVRNRPVPSKDEIGCSQPINALPCNVLYDVVERDGLFSIRKETLENDCPKILDSFRCLRDYWSKCDPLLVHSLVTYVSGAKGVMEELCDSKSELRKDYEKNIPCLGESSKALENCLAVAERKAISYWRKSHEWYQLNVSAYRCLAHIELVSCVRNVAGDRCGLDAGKLLGRLLERLVKPYRLLNCHNPENLNRPSKKEEYQRLLF